MRLQQALAGLQLLWSALAADVTFRVPPGYGPAGKYGDNPVYKERSVVDLEWDGITEGQKFSLVLMQESIGKNLKVDGNGIDGLEYVIKSVVDITKFPWVVKTSRDLSLSHVFFLAFFVEGEGSWTTTSHYFNITRAEEQTTTTTTSTTTSTTSSSTTNTSTSTTTTAPPAQDTNNAFGESSGATDGSSSNTGGGSAQPASSSGGLSTGAAVGIGVAIPLAVILGALTAWFLMRRHRAAHAGAGELPAELPPSFEPGVYYSGTPKEGGGAGGWGAQPMSQTTPVSAGPRYPPVELDEPRRFAELG